MRETYTHTHARTQRERKCDRQIEREMGCSTFPSFSVTRVCYLLICLYVCVCARISHSFHFVRFQLNYILMELKHGSLQINGKTQWTHFIAGKITRTDESAREQEHENEKQKCIGVQIHKHMSVVVFFWLEFPLRKKKTNTFPGSHPLSFITIFSCFSVKSIYILRCCNFQQPYRWKTNESAERRYVMREKSKDESMK